MRAFKNFNFEAIYQECVRMLATAPDVRVGEWQAIQGDIPQADTIEIEDISFQVPIGDSVLTWQEDVKPNLPWAEDHFLERVSGEPLNPPPSAAWWPYAQKAHAEHVDANLQFSHTYPERFWPKYANASFSVHEGIRYDYGDLGDVLRLLRSRPGTRQAYLPVWFPEDTGAAENQRVPCTLGYHFLLRQGKLKIVYYIRSCDLYRHFRDDAYLAGRLCQWVANKVGDIATPDRLVMHISSLHVFSAERGRLQSDIETWKEYSLGG